MVCAKQSPGVCAPAPAPTGLYKPTDIVVKRLDPSAERHTILGLIRCDRAFGAWSVMYLVQDAAGELHELCPEAVYRVWPTLPPSDLFAIDPDDQGVADDDTPLTVAGEPAGIMWVAKQNSAGQESAGERFEVAPTGILWGAHDYWTGEETTGRSGATFAKDWCAGRLEGALLDWTWHGEACVAVLKDIFWRVYPDAGGWFGLDGRFAVGELQSRSPLFDTAAEAKAWCAIRAACALAKTEGKVTRLVYEAPKPTF